VRRSVSSYQSLRTKCGNLPLSVRNTHTPQTHPPTPRLRHASSPIAKSRAGGGRKCGGRLPFISHCELSVAICLLSFRIGCCSFFRHWTACVRSIEVWQSACICDKHPPPQSPSSRPKRRAGGGRKCEGLFLLISHCERSVAICFYL